MKLKFLRFDICNRQCMWNFWTAVLAKMHLADWIYFSNLTFLAEIFYLGNAIVLCQGEKS